MEPLDPDNCADVVNEMFTLTGTVCLRPLGNLILGSYSSD
ncbi:hypothetical protein EKPJFOCH_3444 [Methylobacterium thuringiense]|uniref:Uncharacterized protein n=1 Tax=Methylobacterium thuringiense TaxID=1003091 RepID=A0ABQ4TPZ9_9HYPH|nr:hypothetical protein EKPJFOCH_3444 [Methylobacterium thuringiense]